VSWLKATDHFRRLWLWPLKWMPPNFLQEKSAHASQAAHKYKHEKQGEQPKAPSSSIQFCHLFSNVPSKDDMV
jgi:hypothetical protein